MAAMLCYITTISHVVRLKAKREVNVMKNVKVEILKETAKAKFVKSDCGKEFWVQNRSYKNGQVSKKVFENSVVYAEKKATTFEENKKFNNEFHSLNFIEKTEKAIKVNVVVAIDSIDREIKKFAWIPISLCKDVAESTANVAGWFIRKKQQELVDNTIEFIGNRGACVYVETFGGKVF